MDKILEGLDSTVFTPALKAQIQDMFESSIEDVKVSYEDKIKSLEESHKEELTSVVEKADSYSISIQDAYEAKASSLQEELETVSKKAEEYGIALQEELNAEVTALKEELETVSKKAEEYGIALQEEHKAEVEVLSEKAEAYAEYVKEELTNKAEDYAEYVKEELTNTLDAYLSNIAKDFIEQNKIAIEGSIKEAKVDAMLEGFGSLLVTSGVAIAEISESVDAKKSDLTEVEALKVKIDELVKENAELKSNKAKLVKQSIVEEVSKDLSLVQRDKFDRLAKYIPFNESKVSEYKESLSTLVEEVSSKSTSSNSQVSLSDTLNESALSKSPASTKLIDSKYF